MAHYIEHFNGQTGQGMDTIQTGINRVYIGTPNQRGSGIGSFLGGLLRRILPVFSRGAKAIGKEAFRTGINVLSDVALHNTPVKKSLRVHARDSVDNLKRKAENELDKYLMEGSGYKLKHPALSSHLLNTLGSLSSERRKKKSTTTSVAKVKKNKRRKIVKRKIIGGLKKTKKYKRKKTLKKRRKKKKIRKNRNLSFDIFS